MKTIFISGNDTGIGKTRVTHFLAKTFADRKEKVQVIKPIESGVIKGEPSDIECACKDLNPDYISGHTFYSFNNAVAPLRAAEEEKVTLSISDLCNKISQLENCDWRIIEGAGGLAVPIENNGADWLDFAVRVKADYTILIVEDRLGCINQARLLDSYVQKENLNAGIWLNEVRPERGVVRESNLSAAQKLQLPLWAVQDNNADKLSFINAEWLKEVLL